MTAALFAHCLREAREVRGTFLACLALATLVVLGAGLLVGTATLENVLWIDACGLGFGLLVALALGCEIGGRERQEGTFEWLLREPGGLAPAAAAKLVVLSTAVLAGLVAGRLAGALSAGLRVEAIEATPAPGLAAGLVAFALVVGALWVAAASTFVPRGLLAAPAGLLLLASVAAPAVLWLDLLPNHGLDTGVVRIALCLAAVGGVAAFAAGFARGARRVRPAWRRGVAAALGGLLALAPLWAMAVPRLHRVATIDPHAADFRLNVGMLSEDGDRALLVAQRALGGGDTGPWFQLEVELETGAWRTLPEDSPFDRREPGRPEPRTLGYDSRVGLLPAGHGFRARGPGLGLGEWLDADGARRLPASDRTFWLDGAHAPLRVWVRAGDWLADYGSGRHALLDLEGRRVRPARGLELEDAADPESGTAHVLALLADGRVFARVPEGLVLLDPDTGEREAVALPPSLEGGAVSPFAAYGYGLVPTEERPAAFLFGLPSGRELALFDGRRLAPLDTPEGVLPVSVVGLFDDGSAAVVGSDQALWRLASAPVEPVRLFPR